MPTPGTPAWFGPGASGQTPDTREQGARAVFAAATPGLCICLLIGGLVYMVAPVMLLVSFGLARRVWVSGKRVRTAFGVGLGLFGLLAILGSLTSETGFAAWWGYLGVWALVICWGLLVTTLRSSVTGWSPTTSIADPPTRTRGVSGPVRTPRPRTLPEALRELSPEALTELIERRPDLGSPPPLDLAELATRSTTSSSISRALDGLNAWQRVVVEALAALPDPTTSAELIDLLASEPDAVARALRELRERALLWGDDDQLHLVRPVREAQLPYPGGLAPVSSRPLTDARIAAELAACGADDLAVLERLMWSPAGAVRNAARPVSIATARTPVERLLSRQLLRPLDADKVILPREVPGDSAPAGSLRSRSRKSRPR